jgi:hypothetical protein
MFIRIVLFAIALAALGCATSHGFNRGELRGELGKAAPVEINDHDIQTALDKKPQLPKPFKLAVYFKNPSGTDASRWRWTGEDKNKILSLAEQMKEAGEISDVFAINDDLVYNSDLRNVRYAAAEHGADAVLVVSGANDVDSYNNMWAWTYVALLPALFVPGNESDVLFMVRAVMWDVRNEFLYMSAEAESEKSHPHPAAFIREREVVQAAKAEAIDKLREQIAKMASGLDDKPQAAK